MPEIKVQNKFLVGINGDDLVFLKPLPQRLSHDEAILLAAYLVALATEPTHPFAEVLAAVENA